MDPTKLLEADHRKVEDLIEKIRDAEGDERMELLRELESDIKAHMQLEEVGLYPIMTPVTGEETAEEGRNEHDVARTAMQEMMTLAPDEPGFPAALDALEAAIEHHVEDEEKEVFPELRDKGAEILAANAQELLAKRRELGLPVDAQALSAGFTKEEMLDEARELGLDGTSDMSKEELAQALVSRMAS